MTLSRSLEPTVLSFVMALVVAGCDTLAEGNFSTEPRYDLLTSDAGFVTTGGAEITIIIDDFTERWSFVAKRGQGAVADGNFQWSGKIFGDHVNAHGLVRCFSINGNRARVGGVVTHSNPEGLVGAEIIWSVEDNGEGSNVADPDRASTLALGDPEVYCLTAPVLDLTLLAVESGNVQVHSK